MRARQITGYVCLPALAWVTAVVLAAAPAEAAAPVDGCPVGYNLMSVAELSALGYLVPAQVDSSTSGVLSFGQPGNDDGYVCAVKLGKQLTPWNTPIYNFLDNGLPA